MQVNISKQRNFHSSKKKKNYSKSNESFDFYYLVDHAMQNFSGQKVNKNILSNRKYSNFICFQEITANLLILFLIFIGFGYGHSPTLVSTTGESTIN